MNLTILTQWFPPEHAPIGYMIKELADELVSDGHDVTIITGFPNHPSGIVFGGYKKKWMQVEYIGSVRVIRVWLATSPKRTRWRRLFTFITFTLTSAWALVRYTKVQLIFAVFQPLSVGVTLPFLARMKGAKLILNIQDLHPDVPIELGLVSNPVLIRALKMIEWVGYAKSDGLAVICDSFKTHCAARGGKDSAIDVIPNWIDLNEIKPENRNNNFRDKIGLNESHFVVLYAGTIGWVSGANIMLDVACQLLELSSIRIVFVGEGAMVPELKTEVATRKLTNVIFVPFQRRSILSEVQSVSDVSVISLKPGKGKTSVPSKVLGYMAAARPIVASVDSDSETASMIVQASCGRVVEPGNSVKFAEEICALQFDSDLRRKLGMNGRNYLEQHYAKGIITKKYIDFFKRVVKDKDAN